MVEVSITAEELGFHGVWIGEHIISPTEMSSHYPYAASTTEAPAYHSKLPFYDPYAALSFIAAKTNRLRLGLSLSIVPLHNPFELAKSVATIDLFSKGRFVFGIGAGWLKEEFEILGQPWERRGARMEEMLALMTCLWNDDEPRFSGEFYSLPRSGMEPKPLTRPHPPFYFGGTTAVALRRASRLGDGWIGVGLDCKEASTTVKTLAEMRDEAGRSDRPLDIVLIVPDSPSANQIDEFEAAGVRELVVRPWTTGRQAVTGLVSYAHSIGMT
jgi:probable F420-dependent oxidoreductase